MPNSRTRSEPARPQERVETLRQVTNLFLQDAERLSEEQVKIFDDVWCLLIARVEGRARAEFGKRIAPISFAPAGVSSSWHGTMKSRSPAMC